MNPVILFRPDRDNKEEMSVAMQHFQVFTQRCQIQPNSFVIPRYSSLPYYKELEYDVKLLGSKLINSYEEHRYIADFEWYEDLKEYTFPTYTDYDFYSAPEGPYVVKGKTNSRKHQWNKLMYAPTKTVASSIAAELCSDPLIGPQGIIYRQYIPLKTLDYGISGLPFTYEWRFFFLRHSLSIPTCIGMGYYWSTSDIKPNEIPLEIKQFAYSIASQIDVPFFVLDVALTSKDEPILVEINDGTMSGLSDIDMDEFYKSLKEAIQ